MSFLFYFKWRDFVEEEMIAHNDSFDNVQSKTITDEYLDNDFFSGDIAKFLIWTSKRVYFPCECEGLQSCESVPRNPE